MREVTITRRQGTGGRTLYAVLLGGMPVMPDSEDRELAESVLRRTIEQTPGAVERWWTSDGGVFGPEAAG